MRARAIAHGAISIVNAIPSGKGAALAIRLRACADVRLDRSGEVRVTGAAAGIAGGALPRLVCARALQAFGGRGMGAEVRVDSEIPPSRGLKSSSAVAVAVALATIAALGQRASDEELLRLVALACREAGVSITGAVDDAAACLLGGLAVANCEELRVLRRLRAPRGLVALLLVPERVRPKALVPVSKLRALRPLAEQALELVLQGRWPLAMTLNGLLCCAALDESPLAALQALEEGALAAGLTGTGPAVAAVCRPLCARRIAEAWAGHGETVLRAALCSSRAKAVRLA